MREILAETFPYAEFAEAGNARETLEYIRKGNWTLVILDISLPGRSGIDILNELKHTRPQLPVLVLSMHPEEQFARRALLAGASGYLTKGSVPEELVRAVQRIVAGGRFISDSLAEKLAEQLNAPGDQPLHQTLSDREFQILRMIAQGNTVAQIAEGLFLSVKTVSTYRSRLLLKMGFKNNAELMRYAMENHLVE